MRSTSRCAGPQLGVVDALMGAGRRSQRLREQLGVGDVDAQLAPATGNELALGADPVAEVEVLEQREDGRREVVVLEQELQVTRFVVDRGEGEPAVAAEAGDATGDALLPAGAGVRGQVGVGRVEHAGGTRALEPVGLDVDPGGPQCVQAGQPLGPLLDQTVSLAPGVGECI